MLSQYNYQLHQNNRIINILIIIAKTRKHFINQNFFKKQSNYISIGS